MNETLRNLLAGLIDALDPVIAAFEDPDELVLLLEDLGWNMDPGLVLDALFDANGDWAQFARIVADIREMAASAQAVAGQIRAGQDIDAQAILALAQDFRDVFAALGQLKGPGKPAMPDILSIDDLWQSLIDDLPDMLIIEHVATAMPGLHAGMEALGLFERRVAVPQGTLRQPYTQYLIHWDRFGDLLGDPLQHMREVYRWNGAVKPGADPGGFDFDRAAQAVLGLAQTIRFPAAVTPVDPGIVARHYEPLNVPEPRPLSQLFVPVAEGSEGGAHYRLALIAAPALKAPDGETEGLLLTQLAQGGVSRTITLADGWLLALAGSADADFALELTMTPDGVDFAAQAPQPPSLSVTLTGQAPADPDHPDLPPAWPLFGGRGETGLSLRGVSAGIGMGPADGVAEVTLSLALEGLALTIAAGEGDGLLNAILGSLDLRAELGLALHYGTVSGFRFEGSGGLSVVIALDKSIGPLTLDAAEVSIVPGAGGVRTEGLLSASFELGPLFARAERMGLSIELTPAANGGGLIGPMDLNFGFVPPSGYAVALNADPITGGGYLSVSDTEYRGAMALGFRNFGFSAFAILNTELPGGEEGFSFAGSIFAEFSVPLAFGFLLTGVGGFIGINRTIDTGAMREVLFAGRLDDLLFPADPIGAASQILEDMATIMPPMEGQHIVGPCVRISWGQPALIHITMGVLLEFGQDFRVVILGGLSMILPDKDKVLVSLRLQFMGEIDFTAGTISFDATLEGSRILTYAVDGDVAIRTGWGRGIAQVASFGGLHPDYPKPANLPDLARLSISFGGNNPKLTLSAYQAVTYNSLQVGARADMYAKGPKVKFVGQVAAEGYVAFDALIYFNPFSFQVGLRGGLSILVDGDVKAGLFFSLTLKGPNSWYINGEVWVKILGIKVRFGIEHRWGQRESVQTFVASPVALLREALERSEGFRPVEGQASDPAVSFRQLAADDRAIDPLGGLEFAQNAVPLAVRLGKVGEAEIDGPATVDIRVLKGTREMALGPAEAEFVRGHFFGLTEAQRLSDPVFEYHKAGFTFSDQALVAAPSSISDEYAYEIFEIPMDDSDRPGAARAANPGAATFRKVMNGQLAGRLRGPGAQQARLVAQKPVSVAREGFVSEAALEGVRGGLGIGAELSENLHKLAQTTGPLSAQRQNDMPAATPVASYIAL